MVALPQTGRKLTCKRKARCLLHGLMQQIAAPRFAMNVRQYQQQQQRGVTLIDVDSRRYER